MKKSRIQRPLLALLTLLAAAAARAGPDGAAIYAEHCSSCHQTEGKGGIGLPLTPDILGNVSDEYLRKTIRVGRPGRVMPAFPGLSDAQVDAMVAYLREKSGVPGKQFDPAPIEGDPLRGSELFASHCIECHGKDGSGQGLGTGVTLSRERSFAVMPAAIGNPGFLASASDAMIRHAILEGRDSRGMPAFGTTLDGAEINDIVAYLRSLEQPLDEDLQEPLKPSHLVESPVDFETTVSRIKRALSGYNFRSFPDRYLEQGLGEEDLEHPENASLRFCNFNELFKVLRVEPRLGAFLPCRITVLQRENSVLIVAPDLRFVASQYNNDQLTTWAENMDDLMIEILDEVTM